MAINTPAIADLDLEQLTNLFRLLSDKTRLTLLLLLSKGERHVTALCDELQLAQPTVSHHLSLLRGNGIISARRRGKRILYAINGVVGLGDGMVFDLGVQNYVVRIAAKPPAKPGKAAAK